MTYPAIQAPTPDLDESYERYAIRSHAALQDRVKDPEERNTLIQDTYKRHLGATDAERVAQNRFSPDQFDLKSNKCIWAEHEAEDGTGQTRKYDARELARIVRSCNNRIADREAFPAISDGHTPDDKNAPQPQVLGYHGNYRLGQIGNKKPVWAIFADEYHLKDKADILQGKPRRSVELWTLKRTGEQFFDPVAALGAEAPRLPLPLKFQIDDRQDATVSKYSFVSADELERYEGSMGAAYPGAGGPNTFIPDTKNYESASSDEGERPMMADEDIRQLLAALSETPEFVWLRTKMKEDQATDTPAEEAAAADAMAGPTDYECGPKKPYMADENGTDDLEDLLPPKDDVIGKKEEEIAVARNSQRRGKYVTREDYQMLEQRHQAELQKVIKQNDELNQKYVGLYQHNTDLVRRNTLNELASKYQGFIDADQESQRCLYSMGSQMTDEQFKEHVDTIEHYAARAGALSAEPVPLGVFRQDEESAKYSAALSAEVHRIADQKYERGEHVDFDQVQAEARKNLQAS